MYINLINSCSELYVECRCNVIFHGFTWNWWSSPVKDFRFPPRCVHIWLRNKSEFINDRQQVLFPHRMYNIASKNKKSKTGRILLECKQITSLFDDYKFSTLLVNYFLLKNYYLEIMQDYFSSVQSPYAHKGFW